MKKDAKDKKKPLRHADEAQDKKLFTEMLKKAKKKIKK